MSADLLRQDSGMSSQVISIVEKTQVYDFIEIGLLQCFGILILIDLLPYTFAKQSQISAKDNWTPSF